VGQRGKFKFYALLNRKPMNTKFDGFFANVLLRSLNEFYGAVFSPTCILPIPVILPVWQ